MVSCQFHKYLQHCHILSQEYNTMLIGSKKITYLSMYGKFKEEAHVFQMQMCGDF